MKKSKFGIVAKTLLAFAAGLIVLTYFPDNRNDGAA